MNNSDPLVLIDGIEGAISQVNPNDIASMTVLKDAASAAIYGSKAANSVILITTKTGSDSESARISLGTYRGFQSLGKRFFIIDNSAEYMQLWNEALINAAGSALFSDAIIGDFRKGGDTFKYPNINFLMKFFV